MGYSLKAPVGVCKEFELLRHFNQQDKHGVKKSKNLKNVLFFFPPAYGGHANENKSGAGNTRYVPSTRIFIRAARRHPARRLKTAGGVERRRAGANSPRAAFRPTISSTCLKAYSHSRNTRPYSHIVQSHAGRRQTLRFRRRIKEHLHGETKRKRKRLIGYTGSPMVVKIS